jgi:hypothetical protein
MPSNLRTLGPQSLTASDGLMNRIWNQHRLLQSMRCSPHHLLVPLPVRFPGHLKLELRSRSSDAILANLLFHPCHQLRSFHRKGDPLLVGNSRDHIKRPIVDVQLLKHCPSRLMARHHSRESLQFIILSFFHPSIPSWPIIKRIRPLC